LLFYPLVLGLCLSIALASGPLRDLRTHSSVLTDSNNAQVLQGADLYYENCAVCHGDTAQGLEEARLVFPEDHQKCEHCHKRGNPPQMSLEHMNYRNAFSIGNAPALKDAEALKKWGSALGLNAYISAAMPRPFPGSLEKENYWAITSFLLEINGLLPKDMVLTADNAALISLY
jgi:hypothetical protein